MCRGDAVILTAPTAGLRNGATGTVEQVHADGSMTMRHLQEDGREQLVRIDAEQVAAGHVALGYAITGHKSQGGTYEAARILADYAADRQWAYLAMSRAKHLNHMVYACEPVELATDGLDLEELTEDQLVELYEAQQWEDFIRSITRDGAERSATSLLRESPTASARRTAATVAARTGRDVEEVAWDITDRARGRRTPERERVLTR